MLCCSNQLWDDFDDKFEIQNVLSFLIVWLLSAYVECHQKSNCFFELNRKFNWLFLFFLCFSQNLNIRRIYAIFIIYFWNGWEFEFLILQLWKVKGGNILFGIIRSFLICLNRDIEEMKNCPVFDSIKRIHINTVYVDSFYMTPQNGFPANKKRISGGDHL